MTELHMCIVFADGRMVKVCPTKDKIVIDEPINFTPGELKYIMKEAENFINYVVGEL